MNSFRRLLLWLTLVLTAALAIAVIYGAFRGQDAARDFFNSAPLVVYWIALAALLAAGIVCFPTLLFHPARLAVHGGTILILVGAMLGSDEGQRRVGQLTGQTKIPVGFMVPRPGEASDELYSHTDDLLGNLPFRIELNKFWVERYGAGDTAWSLWVSAPPADPHANADEPLWEQIPGQVGSGENVPFSQTPVHLNVREYLPHARAQWPPPQDRMLEVISPQGRTAPLAARAGSEAKIADEGIAVRVLRSFGNLKVAGLGQVEDIAGPPENPAVQVEFTCPEGEKQTAYLFQRVGSVRLSGVLVRYLPLLATGAAAEKSSDVPAMRVELAAGGAKTDLWLAPASVKDTCHLPLWVLARPYAALGSPAGATSPAAAYAGLDLDERDYSLMLHLVPPEPPAIRAFRSDLSILQGDNAVVRKVIAVNNPLHYGGYHIYQNAYDVEKENYTVLEVKSDSGLKVVWTGMAVLCAGAFWSFWIAPAAAYLRRGREE
jgi:hypothetical protein